MTERRTALVLGATGGIGGEVAEALLARGWAVRALHRDPKAAAARTPWLRGLDWRPGDAMRPADVAAAAAGAGLILHGVNPPGYRRWAELVLPMLEASIAAARASGARILLPGTIYNYGPDAFPVLDEAAAQNPETGKGRIRAAMERRLRDAAAEGVRSLVVRAGDFFGPRAGNSWFAQGLLGGARPVRTIRRPGRPGIGHAWAYLPDLAETMVRLMEREAALDPVASFHFGGHWDADGTAMPDAIRRVIAPTPRIGPFPWWLVAAAAPFLPTLGGLWEMRHVWRVPIRLDNRRLIALLGEEPHTPLDRAVRATLAGLGALGMADRPKPDLPAALPGRSMPAGSR
jgi:nucleoside-diphosphate-sugar epimerase